MSAHAFAQPFIIDGCVGAVVERCEGSGTIALQLQAGTVFASVRDCAFAASSYGAVVAFASRAASFRHCSFLGTGSAAVAGVAAYNGAEGLLVEQCSFDGGWQAGVYAVSHVSGTVVRECSGVGGVYVLTEQNPTLSGAGAAMRGRIGNGATKAPSVGTSVSGNSFR